MNDRMIKGKDLQLEIIWNPSICGELFNCLASAENWTRQDLKEGEVEPRSGNVQLSDCLGEFKVTETLDEDNKWYCSKCKDHVIANKTLELYRTPPILIITLKRFKTGRSKYGFGVGGSKLETQVDFPLDGLDMGDYVLCQEQRRENKLIYDCFAVSNHFGNVGFGHYTAFGKSSTNNKWYNFDDSHVSPCREPTDVITNSAYSLFYRLRGYCDLNKPDFEKMSLKPTEDYMKSVANQKK